MVGNRTETMSHKEEEEESMQEDNEPVQEKELIEEIDAGSWSSKRTCVDTLLEEGEMEEESSLTVIPSRGYNRESDYNTVVDLLTGEKTTVIPIGSRLGNMQIDAYDERMGYGKDPVAIKMREEREKIVEQARREHSILVPASPDDIAHPKIITFQGELEPGGPLVTVKEVMPDPSSTEHMTYLAKQKGIHIYDQGRDIVTGEIIKNTLQEALESSDRVPYSISKEGMVTTYGIKNIKKLAINSVMFVQAGEFFAENLVEIIREQFILPMIIPRPYLIFCFAPLTDGLGQQNFDVISEYLIIFRALEAKNPKIQSIGLEVSPACRSASYGTLPQFVENLVKIGKAVPRYIALEKNDIFAYIKELHEKKPKGKKHFKLNKKHGLNDKQILRFAFLNRARSTRQLADGFCTCVSELIVKYAKEMEIIEPGTTDFDSLVIDSCVHRYSELGDLVCANPSFLQDLFKLQCEFTFGYMKNLEEFILLLCYKNIPLSCWDAIGSKPMSDPAYPPGSFCKEANEAIAQAISLWEGKSMVGTIKTIREIQERVQYQRSQRMGTIPVDVPMEKSCTVVDESPRLYGEHAYSAPTMYQMKMYLKWIFFLTEKVIDRSKEVAQKNKLFETRARDRIAAAREQGRRIILHNRDGSTIQDEVKKRTSRE